MTRDKETSVETGSAAGTEPEAVAKTGERAVAEVEVELRLELQQQ